MRECARSTSTAIRSHRPRAIHRHCPSAVTSSRQPGARMTAKPRTPGIDHVGLTVLDLNLTRDFSSVVLLPTRHAAWTFSEIRRATGITHRKPPPVRFLPEKYRAAGSVRQAVRDFGYARG